ncbi:MAG: Uma2 family endonuclease [Bacteroidota bacterium]
MTMSAVATRKMTYQEFAEIEFPDDDPYLYELLKGYLVRKNAPSGEHQFAQSRLLRKLDRFVEDNDLGMVFSSPTAVILSQESAPQPDLTFLSEEKMGNFDPEWGIRGTPDLVVEIISPSSYKRDHFTKKKLYEQFGIPEYWIVDPLNQSIEIYTLKKKTYEVHAIGVADEKVTSNVLQGFELKVDSIFHKK